jgi:hypothetical protein
MSVAGGAKIVRGSRKMARRRPWRAYLLAIQRVATKNGGATGSRKLARARASKKNLEVADAADNRTHAGRCVYRLNRKFRRSTFTSGQSHENKGKVRKRAKIQTGPAMVLIVFVTEKRR